MIKATTIRPVLPIEHCSLLAVAKTKSEENHFINSERAERCASAAREFIQSPRNLNDLHGTASAPSVRYVAQIYFDGPSYCGITGLAPPLGFGKTSGAPFKRNSAPFHW